NGGARKDDSPIHYDARDLVTHAICVGMTGSGKTGLCVGLLEEAALDKVPGILIDPKGDITNLLLQFPDLQPAEFAPWINAQDAERKGQTVEEYAAATAGTWQKGLTDWGIGGDRMRKLAGEVGYTIFTPGSDMGIPLNIMGSLAAPDLDWATEAEAIRERISGTVAALLGLASVAADPVRSREGILLSTIFEHFWQQGQDLDLAKLILSIQQPPVRQMGVFDVDTFFPEKDRFALAMAFNTLVASPRFQVWLQGEPLDVERMFYDAAGKPRHSVIYIAHLSDSERMFIVTLILESLVTWMRRQSGTTSLRALLYFDEIFGYFPPVGEPSSKRPLLTLLKQGRAFGLGCVLVTQNPVDIDYKGLTNAGTWFIGKLQAERDKERVLAGLKGALSEAGKTDKADYDTLITRLGNRVFLMHNVHDDGPVVFTTRWAMSYLRGPLTLNQVRTLVAPQKTALSTASPVTPVAVASAVTAAPTAPAALAAAPATPAAPAAPAGLLTTPPALEPSVTQMYLPAVVDEAAARRYLADDAGGQISVAATLLVYQPGILGLASLRFTDRKLDVDEQVERMLLADAEAGATGYDWEHAEPISVRNRDLLRSAERVEEGQGPYFMSAPEGASTGKKLAAAGSELADYLYYKSTLKINTHEQLGLAQGPREDDRAFRIRLQQAARERRDAEVDKLAKQAATQIDRLTDKINKAQQKLSETQQQAQAKQTEQWINIGESVVSMFMGRRSSRAVSSAASKWNQASRAAAEVEETKQALADMEAEVKELEADLKARTDEITAQWDQVLDNITTTEIKLRRTDVNVEATMLGWAPYWRITYNDGVRDRTTNVPAYHLPEVG
ncbi:MAG: ATP-binding protein, partial [Caldilineaceae bacterium]|nr:ATP-binding protein [Caldilineaceae bacterium]